jgi:hypothetical protein
LSAARSTPQRFMLPPSEHAPRLPQSFTGAPPPL